MIFMITVCLSQGFYSCTNIMSKKQVGEERVYSAYTSIQLFITKGTGFIWLTLPYCCLYYQRTSGLELKQVRKQELMQQPWSDVLYWLASPGLLSLLSMATSPEMVQPTRGPPSLITNWENALQLDLRRHFPNWSSFLCDNCSLCQVDTKLTSTVLNNRISYLYWTF